jgi:predicted  nucleic acid-binding Zn-ribbon protein
MIDLDDMLEFGRQDLVDRLEAVQDAINVKSTELERLRESWEQVVTAVQTELQMLREVRDLISSEIDCVRSSSTRRSLPRRSQQGEENITDGGDSNHCHSSQR